MIQKPTEVDGSLSADFSDLFINFFVCISLLIKSNGMVLSKEKFRLSIRINF